VAKKKALSHPLSDKRQWIEETSSVLSVARQCALAGLPRSSYYYEPMGTESPENLRLMRTIDELYVRRPFYGSPRITDWLQDLGWVVNEKRVARLMQVMGLQAIVPGPHTSRPHPTHPVYPYLLRGLKVSAPNQVWCADITYVPLLRGYLYLVAIMDWYSRYVLAWELSSTQDAAFCAEALEAALRQGKPGIFNTDQGAQFTSADFLDPLQREGIRVSMDGRGRALDNVFIERLWRSVKYEEIYPSDYADGIMARRGLTGYFGMYNTERRHQSLGKRTPAEMYYSRN
jgi:putative transposase